MQSSMHNRQNQTLVTDPWLFVNFVDIEIACNYAACLSALKEYKRQTKQSALYKQALFSFPSLFFLHSSAVFTCVRILARYSKLC